MGRAGAESRPGLPRSPTTKHRPFVTPIHLDAEHDRQWARGRRCPRAAHPDPDLGRRRLLADPRRDSHRVAALLQRQGFRVIPVNPNVDGELLGERCYASVHGIEEPVDVVDVFRRADEAGAHVDEAIAIGATGVWLQLGVIDDAAAGRARARRGCAS